MREKRFITQGRYTEEGFKISFLGLDTCITKKNVFKEDKINFQNYLFLDIEENILKELKKDTWDTYWLHVMAKKPIKQFKIDSSGKWILYTDKDNVEKCWKSLLNAIDAELIETFKISISNKFSEYYKKDYYAIMVYTYDHKDKKDVKKVLDFIRYNNLNNINENGVVYYKTDMQTKERNYSGGRGISWQYSSEDNYFN